MLTAEQYATERAICDRAHAYWKANATFDRNGWASMGPELAAHPGYAACDNAMRGRVEQYEVLTNPPARLTAYLSSDEGRVTVWTGAVLGRACVTSRWRVGPYRTEMCQVHAWIGGREYTGRGQGAGVCVNLRRIR